MNAWAESNDIIVLYPQTKATEIPLNVYGCFDWWGAYSPLYYSKLSPQIGVVVNMITRISGHNFENSDFFFNKTSGA